MSTPVKVSVSVKKKQRVSVKTRASPGKFRPPPSRGAPPRGAPPRGGLSNRSRIPPGGPSRVPGGPSRVPGGPSRVPVQKVKVSRRTNTRPPPLTKRPSVGSVTDLKPKPSPKQSLRNTTNTKSYRNTISGVNNIPPQLKRNTLHAPPKKSTMSSSQKLKSASTNTVPIPKNIEKSKKRSSGGGPPSGPPPTVNEVKTKKRATTTINSKSPLNSGPPSGPPPTVNEVKSKPRKNSSSAPSGNIVPLAWPPCKWTEPDIPNKNIIYDDTGSIKACTIEKIIYHATSGKLTDRKLAPCLLLTYKSFTEPHLFLDVIIDRFNQTLPKGNAESVEYFKGKNKAPMNLRVIQLIKSWIDTYWDDFLKDNTLLEKLKNFIENDIVPSYSGPANSLNKLIDLKKQGEKVKQFNFSTPPPRPILPPRDNPMLYELHPVEVARQLTIIESNLYRSIKPRECIGCAWSKKNAAIDSPNVLAMINKFNEVSNWVVSEVVKQDTQKKRVHIMKHFIEIADRCRGLNNFNAVMEIVSGLNDSSIHRLKNHWSALPQKTQDIFEDLKTTFSSDKNYAKLRDILKSVQQPCIPYLGMYLTDLTFITDGNQNSLSGMINFYKRRLISNVIEEIQIYQQTPYNLAPADVIVKFLGSIEDDMIDKEEAYQKSLVILPRGKGKKEDDDKGDKNMSEMQLFQTDEYWGELIYMKGYKFNEPDTKENLVLSNSGSKMGPPQIKGGTLVKLVERLTYPKYPDQTYLELFLFTYKTFCKPIELLDLLMMRFNVPRPKDQEKIEKYKQFKELPIQVRVTGVFKTWVDKHWIDFLYDKELAHRFFYFVNNNPNSILKRIVKQLKKFLENKSDDKRPAINKKVTPAAMPKNKNADPNNPQIRDYPPEEIARQMCLIDYEAFLAIQPHEFLIKDFRNNKRNAPNLYNFFKRATGIQNWIINDICIAKVQYRTIVLQHLINVASCLFKMKNFFAFHAVVGGLDSQEVKSLKSAWDSLPTKSHKLFKETLTNRKIIETDKLFTKYVLKNKNRIDEPSIPYLPLFLDKISDIIENEEDFVDNNPTLISIEKPRNIYNVANCFLHLRYLPFNFKTISWVNNILTEEVSKLSQELGCGLNPDIIASDIDRFSNIIKTQFKTDMISSSNSIKDLSNLVKQSLLEDPEFQDYKSKISEIKETIKVNYSKFSQYILQYTDEDTASLENSYLNQYYPDLPIVNSSLYDNDGSVLGFSTTFEFKTLTHNNQTIYIYNANSFNKSHISHILRLRDLYCSQNNISSDNISCVAITNIISPSCNKLASSNNIEIYCPNFNQ